MVMGWRWRGERGDKAGTDLLRAGGVIGLEVAFEFHDFMEADFSFGVDAVAVAEGFTVGDFDAQNGGGGVHAVIAAVVAFGAGGLDAAVGGDDPPAEFAGGVAVEVQGFHCDSSL